MRKKISIAILTSIIVLPSLATAASSLDSLSSAFGTGDISGNIGVSFSHY